STTTTIYQYFSDNGKKIKEIPIANWTARWSGLGELEWVKKYASSVSVENSFQGSRAESWKRNPGGPREPNRIEYEKNFNPLTGVTISWIGGIQSNVAYRWSRRVTDERTGGSTKNRSTTSGITVGSNYSARDFKIPIPVWPFKNLRLKNSVSFALTFESSFQRNEASSGEGEFNVTDETSSWRVSPSVEYSFSTAVKGNFSYEYAVRKSMRTGTVKSQEFGFRVNISIRG
ncbi:MAG: hypothetical protein V2A61_02865, partial [Calditrichota bacterium]